MLKRRPGSWITSLSGGSEDACAVTGPGILVCDRWGFGVCGPGAELSNSHDVEMA